jgi:serine/threonine-protein kinase HipA
LKSPAEIDVLPLYLEKRLIGHIEQVGPGLSFTYTPEWLSTPTAFAISVTMPLQAAPYPPQTTTPWFANLLPEDNQLQQIGQILGHSPGDVYGLLKQIGAETAGAFSIGEPQPIDKAEYRPLDDAGLADVIARLPARPLLAGEPDITMSLAGAQTKVAIAVFGGAIYLPLNGAASTHILKPASERLYATVENELLCMSLAAKVGLAVAPVSMGAVRNTKYLLVERYDREVGPERAVTRHHQEDFCQALELYPTQKYETRQGPNLAQAFGVIDAHSRRRARDRLNLLDQVIFACCINDTDRHGKNYSLILTPDGPRLAPGYDFLTALPYEGITRNLAMKVSGKQRAAYLERRHWERFALEVGLSPAATVIRVETIAFEVASEVDTVAKELAEIHPANKTALRQFAALIRDQAATVAGNSRRGAHAKKRPADADD